MSNLKTYLHGGERSFSLKTYLPRLGTVLRITPAALYERQRALVRLGLLRGDEGRGPGSGVKPSPESLAVLLLALAVTDNLSDMDGRVRVLCEAMPTFGERCRFTKQTNLRAAVAVVLEYEDLARRIEWLSVDRNDLTAAIGYRARVRTLITSFGGSGERPLANRWFSTKVMVSGALFKFIADDLSRIKARLPLQDVFGADK